MVSRLSIHWVHYLVAAAAVSLTATSRTAQADLMITLSPNGSGGTTAVFDGTGTTDESGSLISFGTPTDTFVQNSAMGEDLTPPAISLGGVAAVSVSSEDLGGVGGLSSAFEIDFGGSVTVGSNLDDLDGTYDLNDIPFSTFVVGGPHSFAAAFKPIRTRSG